MGRHSRPGPGDSVGPDPASGGSDGQQAENFGFEADSQNPGAPQSAGAQHGGDWDGGEWTGSHRAVTPGRRGVSVGVIVALVAVVAVVGTVILWRFFGDVLSDRSNVAAARCVDGEVTVAVVADPAIAEPVAVLAEQYNQTAAPVGDRCVKVKVDAADSGQIVNGLSGEWPADLGDRPALWIPGSSVSVARLEAATGAETVSDSRSLVSSPVLLAASPQLAEVLDGQGWGTLPQLQVDPAAIDGLGLPGWGSLRMALPLSQDSDATYLAAEAVAAAAAPDGAPATAGLGAVGTLVAGAPELADPTADSALNDLVDASDPATAPVHAVVTTEQLLYQRASSLDGADSKLASWLPPGPTAIADFPTVLLDGDWLAEEQVTAASEFARFMRKPEQLGELVKAGFRVDGASPPASDVMEFVELNEPLNVGDGALRATIADTLTAPASSPTVTIMLDQSMPSDDGGRTRLANVADALEMRLQMLPADSGVGLWTFDGVEGRASITLGALSELIGGQPRSELLTAELDAQRASGGGAVSFTTLRLVYDAASAGYREGQNNSVLVITTGPHTDQSLGGAGLEQYIQGAFNPDRPVAVNIIDFGDDSDRTTWEAVAQTTGGSYQNLPTSDSPELASAIATLLS